MEQICPKLFNIEHPGKKNSTKKRPFSLLFKGARFNTTKTQLQKSKLLNSKHREPTKILNSKK